MKKIAVIGGGVSGISASIHLKKRYPDYEVIIFESDSEIGKRIKISGNGRCNFSNKNIDADSYKNGDIIKPILTAFESYKDQFFEMINLHYYYDEEGRMYPYSNSSKTVLHLLKNALEILGVKVKTNHRVKNVRVCDNVIQLEVNDDIVFCDYLILSSGGKSYLYGDQAYNYLSALNLRFAPLNPSLCPLVLKNKINKAIVGKRSRANVSLYYKNKFVYQERGEIIFKKDGISGIVIFNLSSYINKLGLQIQECSLHLDFIPDVSEDELRLQLNNNSLKDIYYSYLSEELAEVIFNEEKTLMGLKDKRYQVERLYPFKESQVTSGGIDLDEINLHDLSLKKYPSIFVIGELMDVDGKCGGYNINFALACGYYLSKNANLK